VRERGQFNRGKAHITSTRIFTENSSLQALVSEVGKKESIRYNGGGPSFLPSGRGGFLNSVRREGGGERAAADRRKRYSGDRRERRFQTLSRMIISKRESYFCGLKEEGCFLLSGGEIHPPGENGNCSCFVTVEK